MAALGTAVALAATIHNLFNPPRDATGAILVINTQMLKSISEQVVVVQQTLGVLFASIEGLSALLYGVPEETVIEEFKGRVNGALTRYGEVVRTFEQDVAERGLEFAREASLVEISTILEDVREARAVLMGYSNDFTAPVLATSLQCETLCMIMLDERSSRIREVLRVYREKLEPLCASEGDASLSSRINSDIFEYHTLRPQALDLISSNKDRGCISGGSVNLGPNVLLDFEISILREQAEPEDTRAFYLSAVEDLAGKGVEIHQDVLTQPISRLVLSLEGQDLSGHHRITLSTSNGAMVVDYGLDALGRWPAGITGCDGAVEEYRRTEAAFSEVYSNLILRRDRVAFQYSLLVTAVAAVHFIDEMQATL